MLGSAARALDAQRFGLEVAGQNIANANTRGYARRSAVLAEARPTDLTSAGGGVDVVAVTAARAPLLDARLRFEQPVASREAAIADRLAVLEAAFGRPGASVDEALARFYNQYAALAQNPTSGTLRQQVVVEGQSLARSVHDIALQVEAAQKEADSHARDTLAQVNALAGQLATINDAIGSTLSGSVHGLIDQQTEVLHALSALVDIGVVQRGDGTLDVTVGNGRALVVGANSYDLKAVSEPPNGFAAITTDGAAVTMDITSEISGGALGGFLHVRDVLAPAYLNQLDRLAYSVATDVNTLTRSGFDLAGSAGLDFFDAPTGVAGAAKAMSVNAAVAANNALVVAAGVATPGNNDIARAIAALQDTAMTGTTTRPVDAWGALVYRLASDASTAVHARDSHDQILRQLQSLRDQISGVSLDEEAAMLLRFQRAYEANARFFQVADQTLDLLMQALTR